VLLRASPALHYGARLPIPLVEGGTEELTDQPRPDFSSRAGAESGERFARLPRGSHAPPFRLDPLS
jgi:hypothetical protein